MTCVIGLEHEGVVYMGCDSQTSYGWEKRPLAESKIFRRGQMLFGVGGASLIGNALRYRLVIPQRETVGTNLEYLNTLFIDAVRKCFEEHKCHDSEKENRFDGTFLLGYQGKLYRIEPNYAITYLADGFDSIGSGSNYALGALAALDPNIIHPKQRIQKALEIAIRFDMGTSGEMVIEVLE